MTKCKLIIALIYISFASLSVGALTLPPGWQNNYKDDASLPVDSRLFRTESECNQFRDVENSKPEVSGSRIGQIDEPCNAFGSTPQGDYYRYHDIQVIQKTYACRFITPWHYNIYANKTGYGLVLESKKVWNYNFWSSSGVNSSGQPACTSQAYLMWTTYTSRMESTVPYNPNGHTIEFTNYLTGLSESRIQYTPIEANNTAAWVQSYGIPKSWAQTRRRETNVTFIRNNATDPYDLTITSPQGANPPYTETIFSNIAPANNEYYVDTQIEFSRYP